MMMTTTTTTSMMMMMMMVIFTVTKFCQTLRLGSLLKSGDAATPPLQPRTATGENKTRLGILELEEEEEEEEEEEDEDEEEMRRKRKKEKERFVCHSAIAITQTSIIKLIATNNWQNRNLKSRAYNGIRTGK